MAGPPRRKRIQARRRGGTSASPTFTATGLPPHSAARKRAMAAPLTSSGRSEDVGSGSHYFKVLRAPFIAADGTGCEPSGARRECARTWGAWIVWLAFSAFLEAMPRGVRVSLGSSMRRRECRRISPRWDRYNVPTERLSHVRSQNVRDSREVEKFEVEFCWAVRVRDFVEIAPRYKHVA